MTVNDGKGLWDNAGLIDTLILDCNNMTKALVEGNYVKYCNINVQAVQKLASLKEGIQKDIAAKDETIRELFAKCEELSKRV